MCIAGGRKERMRLHLACIRKANASARSASLRENKALSASAVAHLEVLDEVFEYRGWHIGAGTKECRAFMFISVEFRRHQLKQPGVPSAGASFVASEAVCAHQQTHQLPI